MPPKRLPDKEYQRRKKIHNQKTNQRKQKIIDHIEKKYREHSRCSTCNRKGIVTIMDKKFIKIKCGKCKKVWVFKISLPKAYLPNRLFKKPDKKIVSPTVKKIKTKVISSKQLAQKRKSKAKLEEKIMKILKGNYSVKLFTYNKNLNK